MIRKFSIKNFKSYKAAEMPLSTLTFFIGANASGKSNALEAIRFLSLLSKGTRLDDIEKGIRGPGEHLRGEYSNLFRDTKQAFEIGCWMEGIEGDWNRLCIKIGLISDHLVLEDESVSNELDRSLFLYQVEGPAKNAISDEVIEIKYNNFGKGEMPRIPCSNRQAIFFQMETPGRFREEDKASQFIIPSVAKEIRTNLRNMVFLEPIPEEMRGYSYLKDDVMMEDGRNLSSVLFKICNDPFEASLPGLPLDYLRFVRGEDGRWRPAAGTFDGWPQDLKEFRALDPCTGSGHFLVAALPMLASIRMELEKLSAGEAVDAVLRENLHGLEIDMRCVELAAFALGFAAWRYPGAGGYRTLPELNLACSGLAISAKKEEWIKLANEDANLQIVLENLYDQFEKAPILGSLINLKIGLSKGNLLGLKWEDIALLLAKALSREQDDEKKEMGVVAQGITEAALLLSAKYDLIITNVPFLATRKQNIILTSFLKQNFNDERFDLAIAFIARSLQALKATGTVALVSPQTWQFLGSYESFRKKLLTMNTVNLIARLGTEAFEMISGHIVNVALSILSNEKVTGNHAYIGIDISGIPSSSEKAIALHYCGLSSVCQKEQLENPDSVMLMIKTDKIFLLEDYAVSLAGILNGDAPRFRFRFWEVANNIGYYKWACLQENCPETQEFGGRSAVLLWENGEGQLRAFARDVRERLHDADKRGNEAWGKWGVSVSRMGRICATIYSGDLFDQNVAVILPDKKEHLNAIWSYCNSPEYEQALRILNPNLAISSGTVAKVPFDLERWQKVAAEKYPSGLPRPYSDDPTQWIFHGHPAQSDAPLQVALARLLGYRWPAELDAEMELSDEARAWVERCKELHKFADDDGIVCIPPVRGESAAADYLLNLLAAAFGPDWSTDKLNELLKAADHAGKKLESWLRDKFFLQHCRLFQHRPFIWHIWDGLYDGFAALVNYHRLDAKLLESLIYTYLGDWISRQKDDIKSGVDGAAEKLAAAEALKKRLELILEGEAPYDIFVRWKPLGLQPIGWNPDLNDGVRLNIRPFMSVPDVGRKGAGVLREKPNINWNKDRGKDVESAPWFDLGLSHDGNNGDRINKHHLILDEKRAARKAEGREDNGCD